MAIDDSLLPICVWQADTDFVSDLDADLMCTIVTILYVSIAVKDGWVNVMIDDLPCKNDFGRAISKAVAEQQDVCGLKCRRSGKF